MINIGLSRMICVTLLGLGIRLGEMINLKWADIDFKNGSCFIIGKKRELSSVPIMGKLLKELAEYRIYCEQHFKILGTNVFPTDTNTQLVLL
jgi:integrase/recombinase XerD